jgi:acyl-CoA reductase-like NAD-dependent aldehyde dehydrogenase
MAVTSPPDLSLRTKAFIGGDYVDAVSGRTYEVENPATGQTIAEVAEGGLEDVERAVEAAHRAAPGWAATSPADR